MAASPALTLLLLNMAGGGGVGLGCHDARPPAFLFRAAGFIGPSRLQLMRSYASSLEGAVDFWVQFDRSCPQRSRRTDKCARIAAASVAELRALALGAPRVQLHVTSEGQVLRHFPALAANWTDGENFRAWGDGLGRTQHELFVLAWWLEAGGAAKYNAVWVVEDDVRYGGDVRPFILGHERLHGPCGSGGGVDYVGAQFKPTYEGTGSRYLRKQWHHWRKRLSVSREFEASVPRAKWVRKVEYVEKYGGRLLHILHAALLRGCFAFGEFLASSLCAAQPAGACTMLDIACCPPTADHEYLAHCTRTGLPLGAPRERVTGCVALQEMHWVERISREFWDARRLNASGRWHHPLKW